MLRPSESLVPSHSAAAAAAGAYWTGLSRPASWEPFEFADGTPAKQVRCCRCFALGPGTPAALVAAATAGANTLARPPQVPSNSPYAHWSWQQQAASLDNVASCVAALRAQAYDHFLGNSSEPEHVINALQFQTSGSRDLKWAWLAQTCSQPQPYICQYAAGTVTCPPPSPPPPPPPQPPSPPTPASARAGCERFVLAVAIEEQVLSSCCCACLAQASAAQPAAAAQV